MADAGLRAVAGGGAWVYAGVDQLLLGARESIELRGIDAVCQIDAQRPHWRAITDAEADGMHHVVEVLQIFLVHAKRNGAEAGKRVAHIVEKDAADVFTDEREAQFELVEE